jgi:hypothetical protein
VTPYFWFAGIEGDMKVRENKVDIDVGFSDVWDALDFGAAAHIEAKKGKWGILFDAMYLSLSTDEDLKPATAEVEFDIWTIELGGLYQIAEWPSGDGSGRKTTLELLGGGRYWDVDQEIEIGAVSRSMNPDWVDPFVGARLIVEMKDWLVLHLRGDVGGFAVSSDASEFTWNVFGGPAFKLSDKFSIVAGYRALGLDREKGSDFESDVTLHGPMLGAHIQF